MEEMKKKVEEGELKKLKESEEKTRKMEADRNTVNNEDDSGDDLDDLLDDICIHPSMLKKPDPEVTEDDARRASEKFAKAKAEEEKEKRVKEKWFTNSDKPENGEGEEEEGEDGTFSFYKVPWHCNVCGMNVAGDQVIRKFDLNISRFVRCSVCYSFVNYIPIGITQGKVGKIFSTSVMPASSILNILFFSFSF